MAADEKKSVTTLTNKSRAHMLLAGSFTDALRLDPGESITFDEAGAEVQRKNAGIAIKVAAGELEWRGSPAPLPPKPARPPAHDPRVRSQRASAGEKG